MTASSSQDLAAWNNWDGRQRCDPHALERPRNVAELSGVLERAQQAGARVRVAGSGHSFTALVPTDGTLVSLQRMNRVLDVDVASGLVRVEAGITIGQLNARLDRHGLAFENLGDIDSQSVAGATATGTHGTGSRLRNLSAQVHSIELMRADGTVVVLDADGDIDAWRAARVSLGALGVVTALTIQAVPAFRLRGVDGPAPLGQTLEQLESLSGAHDHFEMYWFPYSDTALLRRNDRTEQPPTPRSRARAYLEDIVLVNHGLHGFSLLGRRYPQLIPRLNRTVTRLAGSSRRVDVSHRIFVSPRLIRFTEMEYAIPRTHAVEAIRAIRDGIHGRRLPVSFPIEVRFVAADDALLSPAQGRDTCYIAVHVFDQMEYEPYFRMVEEIMDGFGGRPHWGKRHFQTAETLRPRYPEWDRFQQVRGRFDPDGRFTNAEIERVLGPVLGEAAVD
ncbi:MAG TPA: D-arabinono-1,4-lactone oxidase [Solirubrobacteraceae bacterium]|nr:D-arabinono-1,4-lactone oxidase [Solirubrobacteraceae bacterium]